MHTFPTMTACTLKGQPWTADGFAGEIDDEFIEHVNYCLRAVRAIPGKSRWFEMELDTAPVLGVADQKGTADVIIGDTDTRILNVGDHKFGYGYVDVENNRQMLVYAAAALHFMDEFGTDYDEVRMWIFQPKHGEPRMWKCSADYVRTEVAKFAAQGQLSMLPNAPIVPSDEACKWCPIRANCSARNAEMLDMFPVENPDPYAHHMSGAAQPQLLTEAALAAALDRIEGIEAWCRDVRAEALRRATVGLAIPGYKLIEGKRGNRRWIDPSIAELELTALKVDPYERKLISPTEASKRIKAVPNSSYETISWNIEQPPGAPSLAKWAEAGTPLACVEFGAEESDAK